MTSRRKDSVPPMVDLKTKCEFCGKEIPIMRAKNDFGYPLCEECFEDTLGAY